MPVKECGCCERILHPDQVPFTHRFRDSRPDMDYCIDCHNVGCDLETCDLLTAQVLTKDAVTEHMSLGDKFLADSGVGRKLRHKRADCEHCYRRVPLGDDGKFVSHDINAFMRAVCPGSGTRPFEPVTDDELADVYRSLGINPNIDPGTT